MIDDELLVMTCKLLICLVKLVHVHSSVLIVYFFYFLFLLGHQLQDNMLTLVLENMNFCRSSLNDASLFNSPMSFVYL